MFVGTAQTVPCRARRRNGKAQINDFLLMIMIVLLIFPIGGAASQDQEQDHDQEQEREARIQFPFAKRAVFRSLSVPHGCRIGETR
jgi:hypothetical protein